jgi:hypothetical protein
MVKINWKKLSPVEIMKIIIKAETPKKINK